MLNVEKFLHEVGLDVEKFLHEVGLGVKGQSNLVIAGSPRNSFRASVVS